MSDEDAATCQILLFSFPHHIAHAPDCVDQTSLTIFFKFLAKIADIDIQHIALATKVIIPNLIEDHFTGHHLPGMAHEEFQQVIFFCSQFNFAISTDSLPGAAIQFEVSEFKGPSPGQQRCGAAKPESGPAILQSQMVSPHNHQRPHPDPAPDPGWCLWR